MISKGSYQAVAKEFVFGRANNGTEQVVVAFEIANGDAVGQRITWRGYFTEKTHERTLESLEHAGWDGVSLAKLGGLGSKPCVIVIDHEEGQDGKTYPKVQWVNSLGGGLSVKEKMQTSEVAELEERMRGVMLDRKSKRGATPAKSSRGDADDYASRGDEPF
jgi:hypothetical protein